MIELAVSKKIESLNKWQRLHWTMRRKEKQKWIHELWAANNGKHGDGKQVKRKVVIYSYRTKLLDHDNLVGGAKPLIDALVHLKLIYDDSPEWVEVDYKQKQQSVGELTTVRIEELGE